MEMFLSFTKMFIATLFYILKQTLLESTTYVKEPMAKIIEVWSHNLILISRENELI